MFRDAGVSQRRVLLRGDLPALSLFAPLFGTSYEEKVGYVKVKSINPTFSK